MDNETTLTSDIFVATGDTLVVESSSNIDFGNYNIISTGGCLILRNKGMYFAIQKNDGTRRGFYHSLQTAIDSLQANDSVMLPYGYTVKNGVTFTIPTNAYLRFGYVPESKITIENGGTLNISSGVTLNKSPFNTGYDPTWKGVSAVDGSTLNVNGGINVKNAKTAFALYGNNVTFPLTTCYIDSCGNPAVAIDKSPMVRYLYIKNSASAGTGYSAIAVATENSNPSIYWCTIEDSYFGIKVSYDSDAILAYSILRDLQNSCIYLATNESNNSGTIDISWAYTDVIPTGSNYAIYNLTPYNTMYVNNTWWGNSSPDPDDIFLNHAGYISYSPFACSAFDNGASKIAVTEQNPFHLAIDYEQSGFYRDALDIYYDIITNDTNLAHKRMAIKSIVRVNELNSLDFDKLRTTINSELVSAESTYKSTLEYILCDLNVSEGKYQSAIDAFSLKAKQYENR